MKSILIVYNQANNERVEYLLDTWPELNNAILTVVPDDKVEDILTAVRKLDKRNEEVGIRAFVWTIDQMV